MRKEGGTTGKQGNGEGNPAIGKGEAGHSLPYTTTWTAPFHSKTKTSLCAIAITFRTSYTGDKAAGVWR
jgi:hypothetical protein